MDNVLLSRRYIFSVCGRRQGAYPDGEMPALRGDMEETARFVPDFEGGRARAEGGRARAEGGRARAEGGRARTERGRARADSKKRYGMTPYLFCICRFQGSAAAICA